MGYKYRFPAKDGKITVDIDSSVFRNAKVTGWTSYFDYVEVTTEKPLPKDYDEYKI